jgi:hypothetical protein
MRLPTLIGRKHAATPALRHVLTHLVVPLFLATGMALAYLGGFHHPDPRGLKVDVVGDTPRAMLLAQRVQDGLGDRVSVRTVGTEEEARAQIAGRQIVAAYVPDHRAPKLLLATAGSDTTAIAVERMLSPTALSRGLPLQVEDVVPTDSNDPTGQGIFFYLVALSVGGYSAAIAIGAAGAPLRMRSRAALGVLAAGAISLLAVLVAGPLYHVIPSHVLEIGLLSWWYVAAVVLIGIGLHTFLRRYTTATLVALFVMLNFTSSGGVFAPDLQPGFFAALHGFWIGSGFLEAGRNLLYFPAVGIGRDLTILGGWLFAGLAVVAVAAGAEQRRRAAAGNAAVEEEADPVEEELEETVAA